MRTKVRLASRRVRIVVPKIRSISPVPPTPPPSGAVWQWESGATVQWESGADVDLE